MSYLFCPPPLVEFDCVHHGGAGVVSAQQRTGDQRPRVCQVSAYQCVYVCLYITLFSTINCVCYGILKLNSGW